MSRKTTIAANILLVRRRFARPAHRACALGIASQQRDRVAQALREHTKSEEAARVVLESSPANSNKSSLHNIAVVTAHRQTDTMQLEQFDSELIEPLAECACSLIEQHSKSLRCY